MEAQLHSACNGTIILSSTITISDDTIIDGRGQDVTISGGGKVRVFYVNSGITLGLNELVITNGYYFDGDGGGIYNDGGTVNVSYSTFSDNHSEGQNSDNFGGCIYNNGGTVNVSDSTFSGNYTENPNYIGYGGGIANSGTLTVNNSTFTGNSTNNGGGIYNSGTLLVSNSTFSSNSAAYGGGIHNYGTITAESSTFSGNSAFSGGGINNSGTLTISNSNISGNSATDGDGGGISNYLSLTVINSTFSDNNATNGGGISNGVIPFSLTVSNSTFSDNSAVVGGGIYIAHTSFHVPSTATISNSTFSNNRATYLGGGIYSQADIEPKTTNVSNSTFSGNSAPEGQGGGIYNYTSVLNLGNTIVANSPTGDNCAGTIITNNGGNLSDDLTCPSFINGDPFLGLLQDNGGPTWTHALLPGSPAIDNGDDAQCPATDQRSVLRPIDGNGDGLAVCDIGAYEVQAYSLNIFKVGYGEISISPDKSSYDYYDQITLTAIADPGWSFSNWSGDASGNMNPLTVTIYGNTYIGATFTQDDYALISEMLALLEVELLRLIRSRQLTITGMWLH